MSDIVGRRLTTRCTGAAGTTNFRSQAVRRRPVNVDVIPPPPLAAIRSRPQKRQPTLKIWQVTSLAPVRAMMDLVENS